MKTELGDHMIVRCQALGLEADIEFKTKGFISGTYDAIEGSIKEIETSKELFQLTGKWNDIIDIKDLNTGKNWYLSTHIKPFKLNPESDLWRSNPSMNLEGYGSQQLMHLHEGIMPQLLRKSLR